MNRFWDWYNRHYALNITIAAGLFTLQIVHLVWLTFDPLWFKLFGEALFHEGTDDEFSLSTNVRIVPAKSASAAGGR